MDRTMPSNTRDAPQEIVPVDAETTTKPAKDDSDDGMNQLMEMFTDSTFQFLFVSEVKESSSTVSLVDKTLAVTVYVAQCTFYIYLTYVAMVTWSEDHVSLAIDYYNCQTYSNSNSEWPGELDWSEFAQWGPLMCSAGGDADGAWDKAIPALMLFTWFVAKDIVGGIYLFKYGCRARIVGALMLFQVLLGFCCCSWMAMAALLTGGPENAILTAVGVAFIHDLDEKVRSIYEFIRPSTEKRRQLYIVLTVIGFIIGPLIVNFVLMTIFGI